MKPNVRKTIFASLAVVVAVALAGPSWAQATVRAASSDVPALYGGAIVFDVTRNGTPVGEHRVTFIENPAIEAGDLRVEIRFDIALTFLTLTAYQYRYSSNSVWREGALVSLDAFVDDNGDVSRVTARRDGNILLIAGPNGEAAGDGAIFPTDHWHAGVLDQNRVLNTITGEIDSVVIDEIGREMVATEVGPVAATRYAYAGDLRTEVLYDEHGRWVGMAFAAEDGSDIAYVCRRCQGGPFLSANP